MTNQTQTTSHLIAAILDATDETWIRHNTVAGEWEATDEGHEAFLAGALTMAADIRAIIARIYWATTWHTNT